MNRLGFPGEALGDLREASDLFEHLGDRTGAARVWRSIALVHSRRGDGREASLALLRVIADASEDRLNLVLALFEAGRLEIEIGRPRDAHRLFARGFDIGGGDLPALEIRRARINALQALVLSVLAEAETTLADIDLTGATDRLSHQRDLASEFEIIGTAHGAEAAGATWTPSRAIQGIRA